MNQQWSNGGWSAGLQQWRRAYLQLPGNTGCFSRCQPRCGLVPPPQQQQLPQQPQRPGLPPPPPQVKRKQNNLFGEMLKLFLDPPCVRLPHVLPQLLQCATFLWTLGPAAVGGKHARMCKEQPEPVGRKPVGIQPVGPASGGSGKVIQSAKVFTFHLNYCLRTASVASDDIPPSSSSSEGGEQPQQDQEQQDEQ